MPPSKISSDRNGLLFVELLPKGVPLILLQTSQVISKVIGYVPQPDDKTLLVKQQVIYAIKHGEIELASNEKLNSYGCKKRGKKVINLSQRRNL